MINRMVSKVMNSVNFLRMFHLPLDDVDFHLPHLALYTILLIQM